MTREELWQLALTTVVLSWMWYFTESLHADHMVLMKYGHCSGERP